MLNENAETLAAHEVVLLPFYIKRKKRDIIPRSPEFKEIIFVCFADKLHNKCLWN